MTCNYLAATKELIETECKKNCAYCAYHEKECAVYRDMGLAQLTYEDIRRSFPPRKRAPKAYA